jgi:hypothetical protein
MMMSEREWAKRFPELRSINCPSVSHAGFGTGGSVTCNGDAKNETLPPVMFCA